MPRERLFLIDGSSLLYRAYYALLKGAGGAGGAARPGGLRTSTGLPTGAVYGFLSSLRKILADHRPDYLGIAFDHRVPTFRHEAYGAYKANRKPMPEDLAAQIPWVERAVQALRIPLLVEAGYEADDVIGSLSRRAVAAGLEVVLVTGDKDFYQLLGPGVCLLQVRLETKLVRAGDVPQEFGVAPHQVADVLALWGDPSDNIPGVKGIGEKGAKELIARWGSLDELYAHLEELKPAQARRLRAGETEARLSRDLATIRTELPLAVDLEKLRLGEPDRPALHALCTELEFRTLAEEYAPAPAALEGRFEALGDEAAAASFLEAVRESGSLALEPLGSDPVAVRAAPLGVGLAGSRGEAAYLPLAHPPGDPQEGPDRPRALALLGPLLGAEDLPKSANDLKQVLILFGREGIPVRGLRHDLQVLSWLLEPGRGSRSLEDLAVERLGAKPPSLESLLGKGRSATRAAHIPVARAAAVLAARAHLVPELGRRLEADLERRGLEKLYRDIELPLIEVLADMELAGVPIDTRHLASLGVEIDARIEELRRQAHRIAGIEFNLNSPRQLGEVLFERMKLPVVKKTRKSRVASTDTEVLEDLAARYELPRLILEHRELAKLKGTYVDALPALVDPATGRVHTCYNQAVAATGRLSSSDPNLQNIPIRTELGRRIRQAFVAPPGALLVVADYSQIELRILAHLTGDAELVGAFQTGDDVHTRTAASVFGLHADLVTPELRRRAKVINFGIIYGMSAYGLGKELGISPGEASKLIQAYFERYRGVRQWLDRTIQEAREQGSVRTFLGRVRPIPEIGSRNRTLREYAERTAVNTPIQGAAADLIKLAMVRVHHRLGREEPAACILLQVHDELVLEAPEAKAREVAALVREEMQAAHPLRVPLVVSVGTGHNWLEAK